MARQLVTDAMDVESFSVVPVLAQKYVVVVKEDTGDLVALR